MEAKRKLLPDEVALLPNNLTKIFNLFLQQGKEIYLVGAGVRNILSGKIPIDCDLTTNAIPDETLQITKEYGPYYENDFGMVGVPMDNGEVYEITTFRSEKGYSDFRRPDEVVWGTTIQEDVKRRDFTMNAVVIGPRQQQEQLGGRARPNLIKMEFELIDLVNGLEDFEKGLIRTVGKAEERFGEDALRMMRAIRFAATLGFQIDIEALEAITKKAPLLEKISRERIRDELFKILKSSYPVDGIRLLISTGLMTYIIPEILEGKGVEQKGRHTLDVLDHMLESLSGCPSSNPLVRLATLLHDVGKPASRKFHCFKCGGQMKMDKDFIDGNFICPKCKSIQSERQATTFYGHEVIGARIASKIADSLRLSVKQKEKLVTLVRWHMFAYQPEMTDASIRRFIRNVGKDNINDMMLLRIGDRKGGGSKATSWRLMELQKRIGEQLFEPMEISDMVVNGKDVMEMLGISPGPKVGQILKTLFEEVIEDTSKNNRGYLTTRIRDLALFIFIPDDKQRNGGEGG